MAVSAITVRHEDDLMRIYVNPLTQHFNRIGVMASTMKHVSGNVVINLIIVGTRV